MAKQTINIGSSANDGTGDPLRTAFDKINDNFTEIYNELGGSTPSNIGFSGNSIISDNTNGNIELDPNGTGKVVINADLEIKGSSTQINATVMQVEDNLVEFNRNSSGGDIDAGMYINRGGAGNNAVFYWNEGDDKFKAVLSTSAATATSVTDSSRATIVADFEGDTLTINNIGANDSSAISVNTALQVSGVLSADSIDTNRIVSNDSTAVTVGESLIVEGTLSANDIDTNRIVNNDSSAIEINSDIHVIGNAHAQEVITDLIYSNNSTAVEVNDGLNVTGTLSVSFLQSLDSTTLRIVDNVVCDSLLQVKGSSSFEGSTSYGLTDNLETSTTALSLNTTVHSLAAGEGGYTLADGNEGQIMYFTIAGDSSAVSSTAVTLSNVRNPIDGDVDASYVWYPFIMPGTTADSTQGVRSLAIALFANGAWNVDFFPG